MLAYNTMKDLLEKNNNVKPAQIGKIVEGTVVGRARSAVFLDLGILGTGIIYGKEYQDNKENLKKLKAGEKLFAKIIDLENEEGYVELSSGQATSELSWDELSKKKANDEEIMVKISGANKGGLTAEISGISAFLPVSQLSSENYPRVENGDTNRILEELQKFVGTELKVKIFDLDPKQKKLIISEKIKENEKIKQILKNYKIGDIVKGEITGITDFGVFIKFTASDDKDQEDLEGLIHISELDWQLIEDPSTIVKVGEKVEAKIINIADDKVSLSLKALKKDPWEGIEEKYKKGDVVEGTVTKFNPYGTFIQIAPKIQGLCHISEFGTRAKMEEALKIDTKYKFEIVSIEPKEHRMSLKLRREE